MWGKGPWDQGGATTPHPLQPALAQALPPSWEIPHTYPGWAVSEGLTSHGEPQTRAGRTGHYLPPSPTLLTVRCPTLFWALKEALPP